MKPPDATSRVHPLLKERYSPRCFDPTHTVSDHQIVLLLEAARWAPSAGNSQPWKFLPAARGSAIHAELLPLLAASARSWASDASLLVLNFVATGHGDLIYSEFADYDLGQAVAHMTLEAQALAMHARQFRAFDLERVSQRLAVEEAWALRTMTAFGRSLDAARPDRERRDLAELIPAGWKS